MEPILIDGVFSIKLPLKVGIMWLLMSYCGALLVTTIATLGVL